MLRFTYQRLHIPTGSQSHCTVILDSAREMLVKLNEWNATDPGRWQYWIRATDALGVPNQER